MELYDTFLVQNDEEKCKQKIGACGGLFSASSFGLLSMLSHGFLGDSDNIPKDLLFSGSTVGNQIGDVLFNIGVDHG